MAAAKILFTHNNLHSGSPGQEPTLLAGRMGLASNSDAEEGDPITERPRREQGGEQDSCGFFASGDSVINFLLAVLLPFSLTRKASCSLHSSKTSWKIATPDFFNKIMARFYSS